MTEIDRLNAAINRKSAKYLLKLFRSLYMLVVVSMVIIALLMFYQSMLCLILLEIVLLRLILNMSYCAKHFRRLEVEYIEIIRMLDSSK